MQAVKLYLNLQTIRSDEQMKFHSYLATHVQNQYRWQKDIEENFLAFFKMRNWGGLQLSYRQEGNDDKV